MSEGQTLHPEMEAYLQGLEERREPEPGVFTLDLIRGLLELTDTLSQQVEKAREGLTTLDKELGNLYYEMEQKSWPLLKATADVMAERLRDTLNQLADAPRTPSPDSHTPSEERSPGG